MKPKNAIPLRLVPITGKTAAKWIRENHRHLKRLNGFRFAVAVADSNGRIRGVGCVGNGPRVWENSSKMCITRIATDGTPNAYSMLYAALCRAGKALGYTEAWTWTLPTEPGTSLRAAGFQLEGTTQGGEWSRKGRKRLNAEQPCPKLRWMKKL